jgi:hypothetical protein
MKVKFKTEYLFGRNPMKPGDIIEVPELVARYLVDDLKVAEIVEEIQQLAEGGGKSGKKA